MRDCLLVEKTYRVSVTKTHCFIWINVSPQVAHYSRAESNLIDLTFFPIGDSLRLGIRAHTLAYLQTICFAIIFSSLGSTPNVLLKEREEFLIIALPLLLEGSLVRQCKGIWEFRRGNLCSGDSLNCNA